MLIAYRQEAFHAFYTTLSQIVLYSDNAQQTLRKHSIISTIRMSRWSQYQRSILNQRRKRVEELDIKPYIPFLVLISYLQSIKTNCTTVVYARTVKLVISRLWSVTVSTEPTLFFFSCVTHIFGDFLTNFRHIKTYRYCQRFF